MAVISSIDGISAVQALDQAAKMTGVRSLGQTPLKPDGTLARGDILKLARNNEMHFTSDGMTGSLEEAAPRTFEDAMLEALNGVNDSQIESNNAIEAMLTDPDSVDTHDVTIAMAKANMTLNITRTVLDSVVRSWRDLINMR